MKKFLSFEERKARLEMPTPEEEKAEQDREEKKRNRDQSPR